MLTMSVASGGIDVDLIADRKRLPIARFKLRQRLDQMLMKAVENFFLGRRQHVFDTNRSRIQDFIRIAENAIAIRGLSTW
jgi:hypothetical protein